MIKKIKEFLKTVKYPGYSRDIMSFGLISDIKIEDNILILDFSKASLDIDVKEQLSAIIKKSVKQQFDFETKFIFSDSKPIKNQFNSPVNPESLSQVKNIIAIASGKGGVGKSTIALNLACQLSKTFKVGILDLDIYGPSLPILTDINKRPEIDNNKKIDPIEKFGMKLMSFGFINNENTSTIWRGPMVSRMTQQFFEDVNWGKLDYLILDLPPGTGDIQLTLLQKIIITGAIIITTPQDLALVDVSKGADMFRKVNADVIGVIENMSGLFLSGHVKDKNNQIIQDGKIFLNEQNEYLDIKESIFKYKFNLISGHGGVSESQRLNVNLLGQLPFDPNLLKSSDKGRPFILDNENTHINNEFEKISKYIIDRRNTFD